MSLTIPAPDIDLTSWKMILSAGIVVQSVMFLLLAASVATWTILVAKGIEVARARRHIRLNLRVVRGRGLDVAADSRLASPARLLLAAADEEIAQSAELPPDGVKERIALHLRRIEHRVIRRMARGTGVLASIGSCGPFVGLFGTVWGIMNSFVGIARSQTTNLAVVAPGIAEALLATAFGLAAAIPAVLAYNVLARLLAGYRAELGDFSALVLARAGRELDRSHAADRVRTIRPVHPRSAAS